MSGWKFYALIGIVSGITSIAGLSCLKYFDKKSDTATTHTTFMKDFDPSKPGYVVCHWVPSESRLDCMSLDHFIQEMPKASSSGETQGL